MANEIYIKRYCWYRRIFFPSLFPRSLVYQSKYDIETAINCVLFWFFKMNLVCICFDYNITLFVTTITHVLPLPLPLRWCIPYYDIANLVSLTKMNIITKCLEVVKPYELLLWEYGTQSPAELVQRSQLLMKSLADLHRDITCFPSHLQTCAELSPAQKFDYSKIKSHCILTVPS